MNNNWTTPAVVMALGLVLAACSGNYQGTVDADGGGNPGGGSFADDKAYFAGRVQSKLDFCRTCHLPGGVADTAEGRRFMLTADRSQDYAQLRQSWETLGRGVDGNRILTKASNTDSQPHSGGAPWPKGSAAYSAMRVLLGCWDSPGACAGLIAGDGGGPAVEEQALLGNPGKHYFVNQLCDGAPDNTAIDWQADPRRFMLQSSGNIDNDQYAVHFNDPFEICHTETLFENQAKQNELRLAAGKTPIHTAKPYAATCGEWRARVKEGHDWIAYSPTNSPRNGSGGGGIGGSDAQTWNKLWQVWGYSQRPDNFDSQVSERYGHSPTPPRPGSAPGSYEYEYPNPYPVIDSAKGIDETKLLSKTFGGTGRLPLGYAQGRDADGVYNGQLGLNCFSCHAGQIGEGEVAGRDGLRQAFSYGSNSDGSFMGLPNTDTELGVLIVDLIHAQQPFNLNLPPVGYLPLVNTTRGTNAADTEIEAIVAIRDFDTLNFNHAFVDPAHPSYGDQDPPAWWWLHNKSRYLWFGGHSTDSSRGNMYFGSVNNLSGDDVLNNEGIFESVHDWSLTVEAPDYPQGYCSGSDGSPAPGDKEGCINRPLAEQGAILFHEKNLWADGKNADIPQPKGNGACAGCHGAYSPRYANDKRFLPDPKMIGLAGYTVPIEIIGTDPAQATGWAKNIRGFVSTFWWSYPDAQPNYRFPENKDPLTEFLDDYSGYVDGLTNGAALADQLGRNLDGMGLLQPLGDVLTSVLGATLPLIAPIPASETMGRVKGACGFEEKTVGYVTPPLHGVWASAPYFHNGSVPTVWDVLKPSDRPSMWRRQSTTTPDHLVNAFEHRLSGEDGGYDFEALGWKHETLSCGAGPQGIPYYSCQPDTPLPTEIDWVLRTVGGGLLWPSWIVPPPVGDAGMEIRKIFNTNLYSKKNSGHEWTQALTDAERRALLEYMKTL